MIKKAFILLQWLLVLVLIAFFVYGVLHRVVPPHYAPQAWRSWDGFAAISYCGVSHKDGLSPTSERFQEHMEALRAAGYEAITTRDIADFLKGERPMPSRAVFIMFEGGRKDGFVRGTPVLRKTGMIATLFVPTSVSHLWSSFWVKSADVRYASRDAHWDIGSMGDKANTEVPIDGNGGRGNFLSRRMWTGSDVETEESFALRVAADYEHSRTWLSKLINRPVLAYAYPFSDAGEGHGAYEKAAHVNFDALEKSFELAFSRVGNAYNEADSNPYTLSRFVVPPDWSGSRLVTELERSHPQLAGMKNFGDAGHWRTTGEVTLGTDRMELGQGAYAWSYGRGSWRDVDVLATLTSGQNGLTALYARYDSVYTYVRVALSDGKVRVQERLRQQFQTLVVCDLGAQVLSAKVKIRLKNNRGWLWVNDKPVIGPFPLSRVHGSGDIGFGAEGELGVVTDFSVAPLPSTYAMAGVCNAIPAARHGELRGIFSPWYRNPGEVLDECKDELRQAGSDGVEVIPVLTDTEKIDGATMNAVLRQVTALQQDSTVKALVKRVAIRGVNPVLSQALRKEGLQVTQIIAPTQLAALLDAKKDIAMDNLLVESPGGACPDSVIDRLLQYFPVNRITVAQPEDTPKQTLPDGISVYVKNIKVEDKQP